MKKIVSYLIVLVLGLFTFTSIINAENITTTQKQEKYRHITKIGNVDISKGKKLIYVGREGCGFCQAFVPGLKYLSEKYGFSYEYIDTDITSDEDLDIWLEKLNVDPTEFGTPTYGVFENGVLKESKVGFTKENDLFDFLKRNGMIASNETYEPQYKNIKFITDDEYQEIIKSNKKAIVLLSQYTCVACINSKQYLEELSSELNVDIYYYDLGFTSQEAYDNFYNSNDYIKEQLDLEKLSTPTFMVLKGSSTRAVLTEFEGKDDIGNFIKDYLIGNKLQDQFKKPIDYKLITIIILSVLLAGSLTFNIIYLVKLNKNNKPTKSKNVKKK